MTSRMSWLDRGTRNFWRLTGRPVDVLGAEKWLAAPMHHGPTIEDGWLTAAAREIGGSLCHDAKDAGLLPDMDRLNGPLFNADHIRPEVRHFYEHTSQWRMEIWTEWNPIFQPGGELISRYFGRRVQQLALPTKPLEVALGIDSRVVTIMDAAGRQHAAGWIRTLRSTGDHVYSGCYSTRTLPGSEQPSVHVAFPLESGNVQVLLRPRALPDGSLELSSPAGPFGHDGAYVVVETRGRTHAARAPIHETFRVYVDAEGVLRTDHRLCLRSATVVRLHYKLLPGT
ncbi:MAG: hypothetical protein L0H79_21820 [Intrasporangium sp.]|nr:hypothetical protein [Intrasporangium sp.]